MPWSDFTPAQAHALEVAIANARDAMQAAGEKLAAKLVEIERDECEQIARGIGQQDPNDDWGAAAEKIADAIAARKKP